MEEVSKDFINTLPDSLLCQILSNLSTQEAASTSILSKRWRYLFAHVPSLDFQDFSSLHPDDNSGFVDFVDRVFELRGEDHVSKFSLKCEEHVWGFIISSWISNVLNHGVSDLSLHLSHEIYSPLPSEIFVSETLVRLKIGPKNGPTSELQEVFLPNLKILNLDSFEFEKDEIGFANVLSGCPMLEELSLPNIKWNNWDSCSVSSKTLKRLKICSSKYDENPKSVSFDLPNVVYLEYSDYVAQKYPLVNLDSLVEAHLAIRMTEFQQSNVRNDGDDEIDMVSSTRMILMGICNVKTLYLSYYTLETLSFCSEAIPVFDNLTHLTIDSHSPLVGWEALPNLLKNCPNLETLVFEGLHHAVTDRCGDVCLCRDLARSQSSLSRCSVKCLKILNFGEAYDSDDDESEFESQMKNIKHFLKKMPNLEQLIVYFNSPVDDNLAEVSSYLQKVEEVASLKCEIQVISDHISFSSTVPTSLSVKFGVMLL